MMKNPSYTPLTAAPYKNNETYTEITPRNPELAKYIRCYWGSQKPYIQKEEHTAPSIVIPDTCVDIIYNIDHTDNTIDGGFCGINDSSFSNSADRKCGHLISTFAIRFYAWRAYAFSEDSLRNTVNNYDDVRSRFMWLDSILRQQLFEKCSLTERIKAAEDALSGRLVRAGQSDTGSSAAALRRQNYMAGSFTAPIRQNNVIDHAMAQIIMRKGVLSTSELARECFISTRQLERLFHEYIGITPKKLCNLIRYQCLWREILSNSEFHIADAVYQYGYTDQSHLIREFKRYHTMDINEARKYACHNVANIQYL